MTLKDAMNNGVGARVLVGVLTGLLIASITSFWSLSNNVSTISAQQKATQEQITRFDKRMSGRLSRFEDRLSYVERNALNRRRMEDYNKYNKEKNEN